MFSYASPNLSYFLLWKNSLKTFNIRLKQPNIKDKISYSFIFYSPFVFFTA